eukprot:3934311-Prymnesium_polylepis.1
MCAHRPAPSTPRAHMLLTTQTPAAPLLRIATSAPGHRRPLSMPQGCTSRRARLGLEVLEELVVRDLAVTLLVARRK